MKPDMKTVKIIIEGSPESVEMIARIMREFLTIVEEGKNQRVPLKHHDYYIRRVLRITEPRP